MRRGEELHTHAPAVHHQAHHHGERAAVRVRHRSRPRPHERSGARGKPPRTLVKPPSPTHPPFLSAQLRAPPGRVTCRARALARAPQRAAAAPRSPQGSGPAAGAERPRGKPEGPRHERQNGRLERSRIARSPPSCTLRPLPLPPCPLPAHLPARPRSHTRARAQWPRHARALIAILSGLCARPPHFYPTPRPIQKVRHGPNSQRKAINRRCPRPRSMDGFD